MKIRLKNHEAFRLLLTKKGFNWSSFGRTVNITSTYATMVINGKRSISANLANRIADILEEPFDELYFIESVNKEVTLDEKPISIG